MRSQNTQDLKRSIHEQSNTREDKVRDIEAILRDEGSTGAWGTGGEG